MGIAKQCAQGQCSTMEKRKSNANTKSTPLAGARKECSRVGAFPWFEQLTCRVNTSAGAARKRLDPRTNSRRSARREYLLGADAPCRRCQSTPQALQGRNFRDKVFLARGRSRGLCAWPGRLGGR